MADAPKKVLPLLPKPERLEKLVHELAADTRNIKWRDHAFDRMDERDIGPQEALAVLRTGMLTGEIKLGRNPGEFKCKLVKAFRGRPDIGVVTIVYNGRELRVITVEWEI